MDNKNIDLFWKARNFRPVEKTADWYWVFWISIFSLIFIANYFFDDYIFSIFIFLIGVLATVGHRQTPKILEYRINNDAIILNDGKKEINFNDIESYNIDEEEGYIFINPKNKYAKLVRIPFEANHNIQVIQKILESKLQKDEDLQIPFLEKIFEKMLGF